MTEVEKAAKKYADDDVDCCCDPHHFFYGDPCWFHMEPREQYSRAFLAGAEWQRERDAEICNEITLANWITFAGEPPEQSEWLSEKCAVAIRKQSKEEK